jgi:uncharacterized membrane protein YcaP (DUF421 family)
MATIIKAAVVYWILLAVTRIIPRRTGTISTPFEMILFVLFGGIAVQGVLGNDHSLFNSLLGLATVALMHWSAALLKQRFPTFGKIADGTPVIVVEQGQWDDAAMDHMLVQPQDVMSAARQRGIAQRGQIHRAVVERNGSISVLTEDDQESVRSR